MKLKKERCRKLVFTNVIVIICLCIINCATVYARMGGAEFKGYRNMKWPVPGYNNLSSCFFDEDAKTRGERSDYHYALDIATGGNKVNVVAAYEGTVVETVQNGRNDWGFGNQVIIRHNYTTRDGLTRTLYTHYSHLSSIGVSTNQQVSAGQYIGKTGGTASGGSPYGIHLDFQILTSANWRLYKTYSKDPFANEMLELPSNLYKGGDTACCDNYISEVKQLYTEPRPTEKPTNVVIELEKSTFFSNEHVTYYCAGNGVSYYVISIYNSQGNLIETVKINPGEYCTRYYEPGNYMAYCEAYNALGNTFSNTVKFTVKEPEKPTNVAIELEKTVFLTTDHVTYYCTGNNVSYFIISIYDAQGNVVETVRINPGEYCTRYYDIGDYTAYCEGYNTCGSTFSNTIRFKVKSSTEIDKPHQHVYTSSIKKPATCTEPGIRLYTCKDNDDSYEEEIPATGHQHTELRNVKVATCAQEGYTGDTYCKDCNTKLATGKSIAKKDHTWEAGKITTVATCSGKGIKTYTCTGCNATRTEEIPSTGHQYTELRNVKAATCVQEGYTGDTYCKDCNTKLASGKILPKTDHIWDSGKVTQNATCTAKGIKTFTCTVCKSTRIEEIPVTGHVNKITKFAKEASCKSEGYTGDIYCQDCGTLIEEGKVIPKTEHAWNDGEITTPATCTIEGIKTYTCTSCGITKTEAIAATGHGATEIRNKKDASVTFEGYTGDTYCTICNQKISSGKKIAKLTPQTATPGKTIKDKSTNGVYKVLQDGVNVEFTKPVYKKASVRIPDTIKVNGITCKVTGISANAFKNNKSLKSVTIGRNVTVIGTNAFYGCKKLSKVSGGNRIVKIGHRAFANCSSLSKITIPGSVRSVGKQAFCNCKKLRSITIKTSTLSGKTVGSKAFAGTYIKPTVKVPAKQMKAYKKLLKARGMSSKAVYRK